MLGPMWLRRIIGYGLVAAVAALLLLLWVRGLRQGTASSDACLELGPEALSGKARDFVLVNLQGEQRSLISAHRDRVVLLHFWFTGCPPCIEELPSLITLKQALRGERFELVSVSVDEEAASVRRFLDQHRLSELRVMIDPEKKVSRAYGTEKFPESYLIDRRGMLRYRFVNQRDWTSPAARACIRSLL